MLLESCKPFNFQISQKLILVTFTSIFIAFMMEKTFRDSYLAIFADIYKMIISNYNIPSILINWNSLENFSLPTVRLLLNIVRKQRQNKLMVSLDVKFPSSDLVP